MSRIVPNVLNVLVAGVGALRSPRRRGAHSPASHVAMLCVIRSS